MQLIRLAALLTAVPIVSLTIARPAAPLDIDNQQTALRFELFRDSDDVLVYTNAGRYDLRLLNNATLGLNFARQVVVVPGISAPPGSQEALDSISGASRPISNQQDAFADFRKTRNQLDAQVNYLGIRAGYYVSDETDYFAQQVSGGAERALFGDNTLLSIGLSYGWDDIQPAEDEDTATSDDRKTTLHWNVVATQVLTPTTILQAGVEASNVEGLQHNPYRSVFVDDGSVPEAHPNTRARRDAFVKVNQYLPNRSSLKLAYKIYDDDWGVDSHTINAKLHQYVSESIIVRYRYRYYTQAAADFFRVEYVESVNGFQTGDYRMGDFDAHLFGSKLTWNMGRGPIAIPALDGIRMNVKYERYFNTNNFSANIFESGLEFTF